MEEEKKEDIINIEEPKKGFFQKMKDKSFPIKMIIKHSYAPIIKIKRAKRIQKIGINYLQIAGMKERIIEPSAETEQKTQDRFSDGKQEVMVFETDGRGNYRKVVWKEHEFIPIMTDEEKVAFQNSLQKIDEEYQKKTGFWDKHGAIVSFATVCIVMLIIFVQMSETIVQGNFNGCSVATNALNYCVDAMNRSFRVPVIQ